jgi:hypothetical protein
MRARATEEMGLQLAFQTSSQRRKWISGSFGQLKRNNLNVQAGGKSCQGSYSGALGRAGVCTTQWAHLLKAEQIAFASCSRFRGSPMVETLQRGKLPIRPGSVYSA